MTPDNRQMILPLIEKYKGIELEKKIAETYKNYQDLKTVFIGQYSVTDYVSFSNKAFSIIEQILNSELFSILPFSYQFQNEFGGGNIRDDIANYNAYISQNDFSSATTFLYRIVYYCVQSGLWERQIPLQIETKKKEIENIRSELLINAEKNKINIEENIKLKNELHQEKENLTQLIITKNQELSEIANLLTSARLNSDEISKLLINSTTANQQIIGLLNQQESNIKTVKEYIKEEKNSFDEFQKELKILKEKFIEEVENSIKQNSSFEKHLENVISKSKTFEDRLNVLNELIGKEGAVKLFNTFNDRKKELSSPVKTWAWLVFITGISSLAIIIGIFTNFFGLVGGYPTSIDWHYLLINSLKSTPIMVVLYFAISQYVKERNYQEEYAFRSAIALTVQAYSDIAGTKKEDLIFKAVEGIYSMPSMMKEKNGLFNFNKNQLTDLLKELNETIKNLKK